MVLIRRIPFLLVLFLCSCATFRQAPGLKISLVNLRLQDATVWETTAVFTVRIQNENPVAVPLRGGVQKMYVNGLYIGEGLSNESLEIPMLGSTTQSFIAHISNMSLASRVRPPIESQRFEYRIESILYSSQNNRRLRLSNTGVFDLHDFQPTK